MSNHSREQLEIKEVGVEHLEQFNELLRYVFQVTDKILKKSGYDDGEIVRSKRPVLQQSDVIGWFNGDQLVSQLCIYPFQVNLHGEVFEMAGLTGVGTYPEYSNLGLMSDLIKLALKKMRDNNQWISYLYPYSIPYYRKKGWELMSDHLTFTIKDYQLPKVVDVPGFVERHPIDHKHVMETYNKFSKVNHGAMIRRQFEWDEYWRWENEEERTVAVYYDKDGQPQGYIMYWIDEDIFHIKEIIYLNQDARKGLWNFISAHESMVHTVKGNIYKNDPIAFLLEDSQIIETITPYFMARIVDVEKFLQNYPFLESAQPFYFEVTDTQAEWNQGVFALSWNEDGEVEVSREARGKPVQLDIQILSTMLMGYRSPYYLYKTERLKTDQRTLKILDRIIPDDQPYFSDYF